MVLEKLITFLGVGIIISPNNPFSLLLFSLSFLLFILPYVIPCVPFIIFFVRISVSISLFNFQLTTHNKGHVLEQSKLNILTEMMQSKEDYSSVQQYGKPTTKQAKYIESDEISDDSMDDNSHMQQGRNFKVKEPKFVDSDVVSNDTMGYHSDSQLRRELSNKKIEDSKRDGVLEDSIGGSSLKWRRKTCKSKPAKYYMDAYLY